MSNTISINGVGFFDSPDHPIINEKGQVIELPIDLVN